MLLKEKQRFSLRKLTIGLASVFLGTTLFTVTSGKTVLADTVNNNDLLSQTKNNNSVQNEASSAAQIIKETAQNNAQRMIQNATKTVTQDATQNATSTANSAEQVAKQNNVANNSQTASQLTVNSTNKNNATNQTSVSPQQAFNATSIKQTSVASANTSTPKMTDSTNVLTIKPNTAKPSIKVYKQQLNDVTETTTFHHIDDDYDPYKNVKVPSGYSYGRILLQDDKSHALIHEFDFSGYMNNNSENDIIIMQSDIDHFLGEIGYSLDDTPNIPVSIKLTKQNMGTYIMPAHHYEGYSDDKFTVDKVSIGGDEFSGFTAAIVSHTDMTPNRENITIHNLDGTSSTKQYQQYTHINRTANYKIYPLLTSELIALPDSALKKEPLLSNAVNEPLSTPSAPSQNALFTNLAVQPSTPLPVNQTVWFPMDAPSGFNTSVQYSYDLQRIQVDPDGHKTIKLSASIRPTDANSKTYTYRNLNTNQTTNLTDAEVNDGDPFAWYNDIGEVNFDQVSVPTAPTGYDTKILVDSLDYDTQKTLTPLPGAMDHDIDFSFVGQDQNKKYVFVDDMDQQKVVDNQTVNGITGQTVSVDLNIPYGYDLAQGQTLPNSYTFTTQNADQIIHLTHKIDQLHYQDHLYDENFNKTIKRSIQFVNPDGSINDASTTQTVTFHRDATRDEVTDVVTYLPWSENGTHIFDAVTAPSVKGYTPSGSVNAITVTPESNDINVTVTYNPVGQNSQVNYVDTKGARIATQPLTGKTDETINVTYQMPANWHIVNGEQSTYHFKAENNTPITVVIAHDFKNIADQTVTVTRTVDITDPHTQAVTTKTQTATFTRSSKQDLVDGHVEHGDWDKQSQHFDAIDAPKIDGYTPDKNATNEDVTPDSKNETINIHYLANAQTNSYVFVDDDNKQQQVGGVNKFAGQTDQNVKLNIVAPTNYVFTHPDQVPTSYIFKAENNQQIVVHVKHKTVDITSGDDNLQRTISRTVNITNPDNHTTSTTESVVFKRTGTKDLVTDNVTYNPWTKDQQIIPAQTVPTILGYTASGTVDAMTVTPDSPRNTVINITYSANPQQKLYTFVDDMNNDSVVGSPIVLRGVTAQKIATNLVVPTGYKLVNGQTLPVSYTFDAVSNPDEKIHLTHKIDTISHSDHLTDDNYNVTITRNVSIIDPDGKQDSSSTTQSFTFYRDAKYDEVTGKTTFGNWNNNGTYTFTSVNVPAIKGYAPSGQVDAYAITPESNDINVTVSYNPIGQNTQINYVDSHNKLVATQGVSGHTNQTVTINYQVPNNWHIVSGEQDSYHFNADNNAPITVVIAHTLTSLPDTIKTVTRTINITDPHTLKTTTQTQTATFKRGEQKDMVTSATIDGAWDESNQTFDEVDAPTVDGYTPDKNAAEIIVTPDSKDSVVDIHYIAGAQSNSYSFVDDDEKEQIVGGSHKFGGVTDQTVKLDIGAPANYEFSNPSDVPTSYTFKAEGNTAIVIHVKHKTADITDTDSGSHVTIARTINITTPDSKTTTTTESVTFMRKATKDLVTGNITHGDWSNGGTQTLPAQNIPTIVGYTPSGKVDVLIVTPNSQKNTVVNITYTANQQTGKISYVDKNGSEVGNTPLIGKTGQTIKVMPNVPHGWVISQGQNIPSEITVKPTGIDPVIVKVEHGIVTVDHTKPVNPTDKMPDGDHYPSGLTGDDLNKSIDRVIDVTTPDGKTNTITQTATIYRNATVDEATGTVTYTGWSTGNWDKYDVPTVIGYTPNVATVPSQTVTKDTKPITITVTYTANRQTGKISYVDENGNEVGNTPLVGKTGETIKVVPDLPHGWVISQGQNIPREITVKPTGIDPVIIKVEHGMVTVDHTKPVNQTDKLPDGDPYPRGLTVADLNKSIDRVINVTTPDGKTNTITQTATIYRDATVDEVTGTVTYTDWSTGSWAKYDVPTVIGYTPNIATVPSQVVTSKTKPANVTVTYTADNRTGKISYVDENGKEVGTTVIMGKVGTDVTIVPNPPKGWIIVDENKVPKTEKVTDQGIPTVVVNVKHGIVVVTPDKPKTTNDKMPDGDNYPKGVGQNDLNVTYTRHITINEPNGQTIKQIQTSRAQRTGYIDEVTGKVTYSDWHYLDNGWSSVSVPYVNGYKASVSEVPAAIKPTRSENVVVTYQKMQVSNNTNNDTTTTVDKTPSVVTTKPTISLAQDEVDLAEDDSEFVDVSYRVNKKLRGDKLNKSLLNVSQSERDKIEYSNSGKLQQTIYENSADATTIIASSTVIKTATMAHESNEQPNDSSNGTDVDNILPHTGNKSSAELALLGLVAIGIATSLGTGLHKKED